MKFNCENLQEDYTDRNKNVVYDDEIPNSLHVRTVELPKLAASEIPCKFRLYGDAKLVTANLNWNEATKKVYSTDTAGSSKAYGTLIVRTRISMKNLPAELKEQPDKEAIQQKTIENPNLILSGLPSASIEYTGFGVHTYKGINSTE
ncbi:unnamed protein product [Allacma fusca]|uniref:Uncharacterized protein n=1 Tax=Allacma fusca TaxID=39272 RepID=A0A8J2PJ20_9HEXA|nr:unnamed protein product [Allacma fusca]